MCGLPNIVNVLNDRYSFIIYLLLAHGVLIVVLAFL